MDELFETIRPLAILLVRSSTIKHTPEVQLVVDPMAPTPTDIHSHNDSVHHVLSHTVPLVRTIFRALTVSCLATRLLIPAGRSFLSSGKSSRPVY